MKVIGYNFGGGVEEEEEEEADEEDEDADEGDEEDAGMLPAPLPASDGC